MRKQVVSLLVCMGIMLFQAAGVQAAGKTRLLLGSSASSSSHYGYWVAVSQLVNSKVPNVEATTVETGAAVDNLRRMDRKQLDLGLVTSNAQYDAYNGRAQWKDKPIKALTLWFYTTSPQIIVVREDSGITDIAGLEGKRINPGGRGMATEITSEAVMKGFGISPAWVRGSATDVVDGIKDNRIQGYIKSGNGDKVDASTMDIMIQTKLRGIGITPAQEEIIKKDFPELSLMRLENAAPGMAPFTTWTFGTGAGAPLELNEEIAYQITKAICEDKEVQAAAFSGVKGVDFVKETMQTAVVPLHPGAYRYYKEIGAQIPDRLLPPR